MRDPSLRDALSRLWDEVGGKTVEFASQAANEGVLLNGRCQKVRSVRVIEHHQNVVPIRKNPKDESESPYKAYLPDNNELADIWQMSDGSWRTAVVPTFDANQPDFDKEEFRPREAKGKRKGITDLEAQPLMRLHIDDMGALGAGEDRRIVRVRKITNAKRGVFVVLDDHNEANVPNRVGKDMREFRYPASTLRKQGFRIVRVDEIGRVHDPGPFPP